jgi:hypothetical protein
MWIRSKVASKALATAPATGRAFSESLDPSSGTTIRGSVGDIEERLLLPLYLEA